MDYLKIYVKDDCNGHRLFVGDKIIHCWGWHGGVDEELQQVYRIHTITIQPAHMMANGRMHDDGGGVVFCMGECYNFWDSKDVQLVTEEQFDVWNIPEEADFVFPNNDFSLMPELIDRWSFLR